MRTAWHQLKVLLQFLHGQLGTNRKFYFNFDADGLALIESSTSILMRTAWHQTIVILQFLLGQLGTNRKLYFNFYADSLAPIKSSTSILMQCKKRNGNNLKNEIATEILVNYFFFENKYFSPRNTENDNLSKT